MFSWLDGLVLSPASRSGARETRSSLLHGPVGFPGLVFLPELQGRTGPERSVRGTGRVAGRPAQLQRRKRERENLREAHEWKLLAGDGRRGRRSAGPSVPRRTRRQGRDPGSGPEPRLLGAPFRVRPRGPRAGSIQLERISLHRSSGVLPESYRYAAVDIDADVFAPLTMMGVLIPGTDRLGIGAVGGFSTSSDG